MQRIYHKIVNFRQILGGRLIQRVDLYTGKYGSHFSSIKNFHFFVKILLQEHCGVFVLVSYQQSNRKVITGHCSAKKLNIQNDQSHEPLNHTTQPTTLKITTDDEPI